MAAAAQGTFENTLYRIHEGETYNPSVTLIYPGYPAAPRLINSEPYLAPEF